MLEEFNDMPINPPPLRLLLDTVSDFHLHEDNSIRSMTRSISSLLLEGSALKNMSITFDNPLIESARNQYKNNIGISHSLQNTHNEKEEHTVPQLKLINKVAHFEVFSDLELPKYSRTFARETHVTIRNMPVLVKKIKKRVKIDQLREQFYLERSRRNLQAWLYEQMKPQIQEDRAAYGKEIGHGKQKLKRDILGIQHGDKKSKYGNQDASKVTYSHIFNVQSFIDMQQSFFPPRKSHMIRLYYPLRDNVCPESFIPTPPPTNKTMIVRMKPKRIQGFEEDLALGKTYIMKFRHLLDFFYVSTQKGSDYYYIANQMNMDYFQAKVLYDYLSKVFQFSKIHKEQRKKSFQRRDRIITKVQELKALLKEIFKDLIKDSQGIETLCNPEETFISYGDIQKTINAYFHPEQTETQEKQERTKVLDKLLSKKDDDVIEEEISTGRAKKRAHKHYDRRTNASSSFIYS